MGDYYKRQLNNLDPMRTLKFKFSDGVTQTHWLNVTHKSIQALREFINAYEYILTAYVVRVHPDGDTEIKRTETDSSDDEQYVKHISKDELIKELVDYGHEMDRIEEAIKEVHVTLEWVKV